MCSRPPQTITCFGQGFKCRKQFLSLSKYWQEKIAGDRIVFSIRDLARVREGATVRGRRFSMEVPLCFASIEIMQVCVLPQSNRTLKGFDAKSRVVPASEVGLGHE